MLLHHPTMLPYLNTILGNQNIPVRVDVSRSVTLALPKFDASVSLLSSLIQDVL